MLHYLRDTADKVEYGYTEVAKRGRIEGIEFLFALVRPRLNEGLPKDYDSNRLFFLSFFFFRTDYRTTKLRNEFNFVFPEIECSELSRRCKQQISRWSLGLKMLVCRSCRLRTFHRPDDIGIFLISLMTAAG